MDELIGLFAVIGGLLFAGFAVWTKHREKIAALQARNPAQPPDTKLVQRLEAVEAECAKLREQMVTVHTLLADEQHQLDRKLSAMLPESSADSRKSIGPERMQG
jgi:hypothetical protein